MKAKKTRYLISLLILTIIITFCSFSCSPPSPSDQTIEEPAQETIEENSIKESEEELAEEVVAGEPVEELSKDESINFFQYFNCVVDNEKVIISNKLDENSFICLIPEKLVKAYKNFSGKEPLFIAPETVVRVYSNKDNRFEFYHKFLLQMKIGEAEYISGDIEGKYVDIALVKMKLIKVGQNWILLSSEVFPKYKNQQSIRSYNIDETYFSTSFGNVSLFNGIDSLKEVKTLWQPIKDDPIMGEYELEKIKISVNNYLICGIYVSDTKHKTPRCLKIGDDKAKALELYGLPDVGYYESDTWEYYFFRDWMGDGSSTIISDDSFEIYFKNNKVIGLALNAYIPID